MFAASAMTAYAQKATDLVLHPEYLISDTFSAEKARLSGYRLGDDLFMVEYEPIVRTSFAYREVELSEQIELVENQGGMLWMNDGTGILIRHGRIAEFRLCDSLVAKFPGWQQPEEMEAALGPPDIAREERIFGDGPADFIDYYYDAKKIRVRFRPGTGKFTEISVGSTSKDPLWE